MKPVGVILMIIGTIIFAISAIILIITAPTFGPIFIKALLIGILLIFIGGIFQIIEESYF